ncbi:MAG: PilZ domain-containing protein [Sandaracinaceae bacterium]|nr:PilZ domain-containing protein [Sandaracinaceae bacterium]
MSDRRRGAGRIPLRTKVWCEDEGVTLYVPALDVSDDGICVSTGRTFEVGARLSVGVRGPEGEAVATARVAWSRPTRATPATGLQIEGFVRGRDVFDRLVERARREAQGEPDPTE